MMDDYKDYYMMVDLAFLLKKKVLSRMIENEQTEYEKGYSDAIKDAIKDIEYVFWQTKDSGGP